MSRVERHRDAIDAATKQAAARWAYRLERELVEAAKDRCPVDEGALRASIDGEVILHDKTAKVVIGSPLHYAEYFHTGTGIYGPKKTPIVPVTKKALKFQWEPTGGAPKTLPKDRRGWYFAKSVKGMKPNPFLIDALDAVMGRLSTRRDL